MKILSKDLKNYINKEVSLNGWVYNSRRSGKIGFLTFRDGFGLLQCIVAKNDVGDEKFEIFKSLTQESSISISGKVVENERAPGGFELIADDLDILHLSKDYPISRKEHGADFLMNNRHLWLRSKKQYAILKVRHEIVKSIRDFFDSNHFTLVDSPILTPNAAEGTSTLFETQYFDKMAYLAQTGQLYGEASAMAFGRHYNFGPCFRAEKSKTRRHLTEFWMVEPEIAFCGIDEDMQWAEDLLIYIVKNVIKNRIHELNVLDRNVEILKKVEGPFPKISYTDSIKLLQDNGFDIKWGEDFGAKEDTYISEQYDRPVIVYGWPKDIKAFYMKRDPQNDNLVLSMDVLAPEGYGEIIGGSERETDIDVLLERIKKEELNQEDYEWYLDLRRYGSVPHSGFGMGLERVVAWICGISHIRETVPFARTMTRITP